MKTKRQKETQERRIHPRYKTSLRVTYKTALEDGISWIRNISRGGILIVLSKTFEIGTALRLNVNLPYDSQPILLRGNVVWAKGDNAGLSLDDASQEDLSRIFHYIDNREQLMLL